MKLYKLILATAILMAGAVTGLPQQRIAVVDLQRVFDGYYKTREADKLIKQQGAEFETTFNQMKTEREEKVREVTELREQASNPALSTGEKDRLSAEADRKLDELRKMDQNIQTFGQTAQRTITERQMTARENIIKELSDIIARIARERSYDLVLDSVARSKNDTPIILFNSGRDDLTDEIIRVANQGAASSVPPAPGAGTGSSSSSGLGFQPNR